jgi:cellulose synthase operon protein C
MIAAVDRNPCRLGGSWGSGLLSIAMMVGIGWAQDPRPGSQAPRGARQGSEPGAASPRRVPDALKFAHGLLRQRKFDLAAEEYNRFLDTGPKGPDRIDALFGLGNAELYQSRYKEARQAFEDFLDEAAGDPRARTAQYRLGELSYLTDDLPAARRALEAFTATKGDHPGLETAWTYLGDVYFALKDLPAARRAYERSLTAFPRGRMADRARYGLGRTLANLGDRDQAIGLFRELAKQGASEWVDRAWLQIGTIEQGAGRFAEVVEAMSALERAAPASTLKHEARLRRAQALVRLGRVEEAETLLKKLVDDPAEPLAAYAALELATIELERNHAEAALAILDSAAKRSPPASLISAVQFRSAEALRKLKRLPEAEAMFLRVVDSDPTDAWADDALQRAAQSALDRGDAATARKRAVQFPERFPRSPLRAEVGLIEARAAAMAGDHRSAAMRLESLLKSPPGAKAGSSLSAGATEEARYELALAYRALGRPADAEAILNRLAEATSGPVAANAQFLLAQEHVEAGRYAQAVGLLERYLAAYPRGDVAEFALAHLAVAQLGVGKTDDAWKTLSTLAERYPASKALPRARLRLAEAALAAHHPDRAVEQFRLVADVTSKDQPDRSPTPPDGSKDPIDPSLRIRALSGLGRALTELGKPAEAAEAFARVLELAPGDPASAEIALARARSLESASKSDDALAAYALAEQKFAKTEYGHRAALARARLLSRLGKNAEAAAAFERLMADPDARDPLAKAGATADVLLAEWGWSLIDASKPADADRVFSRLLKEHPESPYAADARFNLAESANQAHDAAEVIRLLSPLAARKPAEDRKEALSSGVAVTPDPARRVLPAALYRLGRTQVQLLDWPGASATLDRLLSEFPENPYHREARFLRAESALKMGDAVAAESGFTALLGEPAGAGDPPAFSRVVRLKQIQCWVSLKRWKPVLPAIQSLRPELPAEDPAIAELDYAKGQALLGLGQLDEARAAFQAVIDARPVVELAAQARLMRGETFFHEDRLHEALREFLQVDILYNAPRWQAAALLEAGKVYERLQQWADAAETYDRLVSKFPKDRDAATARARREALAGRLPAVIGH